MDRRGLFESPIVFASREDLKDVGQGTRILFSSGGTTGAPKFTYLGFDEVLENCRYHGLAYRSAGIRPDDVVAVWGLPGLMTSEFTIYLALHEVGSCILPIGNVASASTIVDMLERFEATVLLVMPSNLVPVADFLEMHGRRLAGIRLVVTGGEPLYVGDKARFQALMSPDVTFRQVYQTSEVGTIGYQCKYLNTGEFHIQSELQTVEIVNKDDTGVGDLVVTNKSRHVVPVIQRLVGDRAVHVTSLCACADTNPVIKLRGRIGKFVNVGGEKLDIVPLMELRDSLKTDIDDYRLELHRDETGHDHFVVFSTVIADDLTRQRRVDEIFKTLGPKVAEQLDAGVIGSVKYRRMDEKHRLYGVSGKFKIFEDVREG